MEESQAIRRMRQILGCHPPWYLAKFTAWFDPEHIVHVALLHDPHARWRCPQCDLELECCGHGAEQSFLCLSCDVPQAHVRLKPPYVFCPVHGLQPVRLHWLHEPGHWKPLSTPHAAAGDAPPDLGNGSGNGSNTIH